MSTVIGAMEAYLKLNIDDFEKNLKEAREQVASISSGFDVLTAVGDKMTDVGNKLTLGLTTPVIGLGTACVKTTSDFDATMSKVSAISGATGDDLEALRDKAKEMGAVTKFSAGEAGEAFTYMAMAGWDAEQMIEGISGIMDLAAADGLDLATTSDIVTDALTAFGLQAKDSGHFADVLAKASSSANTNVSMLGESFKYVAPVAGAMGYTAEDVAVALGLMANSGIKAGQAGTAMRGALTRMAKPSKDAAMLMDRYNLSITNSDGSMKSLADVMVMLRENMGNLTEAEQIQAATTIFGQEAMSGMLAIVNASDADFDKLTNAIADSEGTAQKMAATLQDNLAGEIEELTGGLETLAISFGELIIPVVRKVVANLQTFVDKLNSMDEGSKKVILTVAAIVAAIGPMLSLVGKGISVFGTMKSTMANMSAMMTAAKTSLAAMGTSVGAIVGPILAVVAVIATLVAAFKHLWDTNEEFRNSIIGIWNDIVAKFNQFCQGIVDRLNALGFDFESIVDVLKAAWNGFCDFLAPVFEGAFQLVSDILGIMFDLILGLFDTFVALFSGDWEGAWNGVKTIFESIWNGIVSVFETLLNTLKNVADVVLGWFGTNWETVWESIKDFFVGIWNSIVSFFEGVANWFTDTMNSIANFFVNIWNGIKNGVTNIVSGFVTGIQNLVSGMVTGIINFFTKLKNGISNIFNSIATFFTNVWTAIKTTVSSLISSLVGTVQEYFGGMSTSVSNILTGIQTVFSNIWTIIKNVVGGIVLALCDLITLDFDAMKLDIQNVMENIRVAISNIWTAIQTIIVNVVEAIKAFLVGAWNFIKDTAVNTWNAVVTGVTNALTALRTSVTNVLTAVQTWLTNTWNSIKSGAVNAWNGLKTSVVDAANGAKTSVTNAFDALKTSATNIFNSIKTSVTTAFNIAKTNAINAFNAMKMGVSTAITNVKNAITNGLNNAVSFIKKLPGQALTWGKDMIQGFANGVQNAMNGLIDKVKKLAEKVRSFLHFTRPDEGPLRDYETWMPDMVQGLAKTLDAAAPGLIDTVKDMSASMANALNSGKYQVALAGVGADIRAGGTAFSQRDYSALGMNDEPRVVEKTEIHIGTIEVRDDNDLDMVTQGLYNKQDQNLRALGRRSL